MTMSDDSSHHHSNGEVSKRRRVIRLCVHCREKKIKCDFARPSCKSCQEKQISPCVYQVQQQQANTTQESLELEVRRLRLQLLELEEEKLKQQQQREDSGSSVAEEEEQQPIDLKKFQVILKKRNRIIYYGIGSWRSFFHSSDNITLKFLSYFFTTMKKDRNEWKSINKSIAKDSHPYANVDRYELISNLQKTLPCRLIILEYIDSFFNGVWNHFFPIVDRETFIEDFNQIFPDNGLQLVIKIDDSASSYARLALILTVLRAGVISESGQKAFEGKFKDDHDLLFGYIEKLLELSRYLQKAMLPTLQTLYLLRIFKVFLLRDSDGGDGSNGSILFSVCFEMAYCLGLHQDIDFLYLDQPVRIRRILKNLWVRLLYSDALNSFNIGVPLHIGDDDLRVELLDQEDVYIKSILQMRKACNLLLSPRLTIKQLILCASELRTFSIENFTPIFSLINTYSAGAGPELWSKITEEVGLSSIIATMIQHVYQLLYFSYLKINHQKSVKYYNLSMKYCLTLVISHVEFSSRVIECLKNDFDKSFLAQNNCLVTGRSRQTFVRCFVFYVTVFSLALKDSKYKQNIPTGPLTKLMKLSELQNLAKDEDSKHEENIPTIFWLKVMSEIVPQLFYLVLFMKTRDCNKDTLELTVELKDYGLYILLLSVNQISKMIDKDINLSNFMKQPDISFDILYDSFGDFTPELLKTRYKLPITMPGFPQNPLWSNDLSQFTQDFFETYTELFNVDSVSLFSAIPVEENSASGQYL